MNQSSTHGYQIQEHFLKYRLFFMIAASVGCGNNSYAPKDSNAPIEPGIYSVTSEVDNLSTLSLRAYGDMELWYGLLNANPQIGKRPDFELVMGESVVIPTRKELDMSLPKSIFPKSLPAEYIVMPGDSLHFIAKGCYGDREKWGIIYEANRSVLSERVKEDTRQLRAGQLLNIPTIE